MTTIYLNKNKSELPERDENDVYETESNLVKVALDQLPPLSGAYRVLDIGSGSGVWGNGLLQRGKPEIYGIEIRNLPKPNGYTGIFQGDFREIHLADKYNLVIGNPPYKYAEEIVRYGWNALQENGFMVLLLRLAFQAGVDRYKHLWQEIYPYQVSVCSRRPSFYGGGTNGTDYGVFFWKKLFDNRCYGTPGKWATNLINYERKP